MFDPVLLKFFSIGALIVILSFYLFIYFLERNSFIGWWTLGWFFYFPVILCSFLVDISPSGNKDFLIIDGIFFIITSMCNFIGTLSFIRKKSPKWIIYYSFALIITLLCLLLIGPEASNTLKLFILVYLVFVGIIRFWAGIELLRISSRGTLQYCLGCLYILWSTNIGPIIFLFSDHTFRYTVLLLFEVIPLCLAIGFLMLYIRHANESYKRDKQQIQYINIHDKLTGVFNRDYYEDIIQCLTNDADKLPLSIILCDVNGLKLINDTLGHKHGDDLLKKIASLLTSLCRQTDYVIRFGGDEFIIILPGIGSKGAHDIVSRIQEASAIYPSEPIPLSMAIGYSTLSCETESIEHVIKKAEEEMYANKLREANNTRLKIVKALGNLLFTKDYETKEHVDRLENLVRKIGILLNLSENEINKYCLVAKLHDIGKITIPEHILRKPGPLNPEEWDCMKKHTETGYRLAHSTGEFAMIAEAILYHHEYWDGKGYPHGLSGYDIPQSSRIIAIIDAYDVMIHDRPYKKAMNKQDALKELNRCAGTQFDPYLVELFVKMISQ